MTSMLPVNVTVLQRGWLSSNNVVFTSGVTAVVDTGYATHAEQTVALLRHALGGRTLQCIVNTHLHSDHCGANAAVHLAYPEAATLIPPGQADAVSRWDEAALSYAVTGQQCARFGFDGLLVPGSTLRLGEADWQIHAAPGHDPHSVILFEPQTRTLISADALWENGFGVVFPELDGDHGFDEVDSTLNVIEFLKPACVIPGHGAPFAGSDRIDRALAVARSRLAKLASDPQRHAAHAMKVLIKFKLLEWTAISSKDFFAWCEQMPYLRRVHHRFFARTDFDEWVSSLVADLKKSGAVRQESSMLYDC